MEYTKTDLQNYSKYLIEVADKHGVKNYMNTYSMLVNYSTSCSFWNQKSEKTVEEDIEFFDIIRFNFEDWYVKTKIDNFYSWLESRKWKLII